jgi:hypothetical protein
VLYVRDPDAFDRGSAAHAMLQNGIAAALESHGVRPILPESRCGDPPFDVAWRVASGVLWVCEVKSSTMTNQRHQFRMGLGQLLEYEARASLQGEQEVHLALAMELPLPKVARRACQRAGVAIIEGPTMSEDIRRIVLGGPGSPAISPRSI